MDNSNQTNILGTEKIKKLLIKFSIPAIVGMVVNMLYNVVDRIYIGNIPNIGGLAISGVGITMPITSIITGFGMLVGVGVSARISLSLGENNPKVAQKYLGNGISLIVIISALIAIFGNLFGDTIVALFGGSESTIPYALDYLRPLMYGTICNLFAFGLNHSIRSDGSPKTSMMTMIIGAVVNIILDPIFIFVFDLGIKGAAYATVISQFVAGSWVLFYFTKSRRSQIKLKVSNLILDRKIVSMILLIGMAPFFMQLAGSFVQVVANKSLLLYGGDMAIGAMSVIVSICSIYIMPIFGITQGSQPIIGYNYAAKNYDRVKEAYKLSLIACTVILSISWVIVMLFPKMAIELFSHDNELTNIALGGIRIYLFAMPLIGIQMTASTYYQAIGKAKNSMIIGLTRQVLILIPSLLILPKFFELKGVWLAGPVADTIAIAISGAVIMRELKSLGNEQRDKKEIVNQVE